VFKQPTYLGAFGGASSKPVFIWSNSDSVQHLARPKPRGLQDPDMVART